MYMYIFIYVYIYMCIHVDVHRVFADIAIQINKQIYIYICK